MTSTESKALRAGVLYFFFALTSIAAEFLFPRFFVSDDPLATARNIAAAEQAYRLGILCSFVTLLLFLFVALTLYDLFKEADAGLALMMLFLVGVGVAVAIAHLFDRFAPLVLSNAEMAFAFLRLHRSSAPLLMTFWGLWLFPFGRVVMKSRLFPKVFGILLMIAGFAYLMVSLTAIAFPTYRQPVARIMMPLYFGEIPIIFALMWKGLRPAQPPLSDRS